MLFVEASIDNIIDRLWNKLLIVLLSNFVKTFVVSFFIIRLIKFFVSRHLETMADYARTLDIGALDKPLKLKRKKQDFNSDDELDAVVATINDMRHRIKSGIAQMALMSERLVRQIAFRSLYSSPNN